MLKSNVKNVAYMRREISAWKCVNTAEPINVSIYDRNVRLQMRRGRRLYSYAPKQNRSSRFPRPFIFIQIILPPHIPVLRSQETRTLVVGTLRLRHKSMMIVAFACLLRSGKNKRPKIHQITPRYPKDIPKIFSKYPQDIPR